MNDVKIITMYLPQFHRTKENDEWWGEGFTEWTTVKSAKSLFEGHIQPKVPYGYMYYNLLDKDTMLWQSELMKKYSVDGQCIYHYWFRDGRQILEKPAENLLKWRDIDFPFCFCWANQTWARTWSNIGDKNVWSTYYETKNKQLNGDGVLLEQSYGNEKDWRIHFDYLLPFFKDSRYIKVEGKPIFVIYKAGLIDCLDEMVEKWQFWARENGLDGIYFIGANNDGNSKKVVDAVLYHEPQHCFGEISKEKFKGKEPSIISYNDLWDEILNYRTSDENAIFGGFVGYDDTPRHGTLGMVISEQSPNCFRKGLTKLIAKNVANGNNLIFINAWNEWGEGMYLEPDQNNKFRYLKGIPYAKEHYNKYIERFLTTSSDINIDKLYKQLALLENKNNRYKTYCNILDTWLTLNEDNKSIEEYLYEKKYYSIAIYGLGMIGRHLVKELKESKISIKYGIDCKPLKCNLNNNIVTYAPTEKLPYVDVIIVTVEYDYNSIKQQLTQNNNISVISIRSILNDMMLTVESKKVNE